MCVCSLLPALSLPLSLSLLASVLSGKYLDPDFPVPEARLNKFPGFYARYRTPECIECTARYAKIAADVSGMHPIPVKLAAYHAHRRTTTVPFGVTPDVCF